MLCDKCKNREANVHVTQIVNGVKFEQNLCSECAQEQAEVLSGHHHMSHTERIWNMLRQMGIVGVVVAPEMNPHTVHGSEVDLDELGLHLPGSEQAVAAGGENVLSLKAELESAVTNENFEKAAELRDKIYKLEQAQKGQG